MRQTPGDSHIALTTTSEASDLQADTDSGLHEMITRAIADHEGSKADRAAQLALLREIVGNPFRNIPLDPSCITADTRSLAQAAYDEPQPASRQLDLARLAP